MQAWKGPRLVTVNLDHICICIFQKKFCARSICPCVRASPVAAHEWSRMIWTCLDNSKAQHLYSWASRSSSSSLHPSMVPWSLQNVQIDSLTATPAMPVMLVTLVFAEAMHQLSLRPTKADMPYSFGLNPNLIWPRTQLWLCDCRAPRS